ncbi:MAG: tRNA 2-selenouridine(34) synthase MnmH [Celeribacter sp.]|jgi:tRNA 2-selenouridine synthase
MPVTLTSIRDLAQLPFDEVIDVRAPSEYAEDHMPGAISLPVLSDDERARVGTIYVQQDAFLARKIGAALVARNAATHLEGPLADRDGGWKPLLYCWRGGQRSGSFASILAQIGWRVDIVAGGYKSYRTLVVDMLHRNPLPQRIIRLDGLTGSGKTEVLARISARGGTVIDLEGLARHRGSAFGAMPGGQPAQKGFETALARELAALPEDATILVEAEAARIGEIRLPPSLWTAMRNSPRIMLDADLPNRARFLARTYAGDATAQQQVSASLPLLVPLQGRAQVCEWQALAEAKDWEALAGELMSRHYDPRYLRAQERYTPPAAHVPITPEGDGFDRAADGVMAALARL